MFSLILLLGIGIVSASENTTDTGDIADLIDKCEDKGSITLDEKTYELNPEETHLYLNKSISIEGAGDKTIIDGKNSTLFLDVEKEPEPDYNGTIIIAKDIYDIRNTGKHITFKNITFKDLNLISRHEMDFLDCKFINTNFTSKELNNSFDRCIFNESKIELNLYDSVKYKYYSKIANCTFSNSTVASKNNIFIHICGSSMIFMQNSIDLINSTFTNSEIHLSYYNINMSNLKLRNSNLKGCSDIINITNTSFDNPIIELDYSRVSFEKANLNDCKLEFQGGYYNKGCEVILKNTVTGNSTFEFIPNIYSGESSFIIENSTAANSKIKATETNVESDNSNFYNTTIESHISNLNIKNSNFYNDGNISDTIIIYVNLVNTSNIIENTFLINNTGKYKISNKDINFDTLYRITFDENIAYYINDNVTFSVKDHFGNPVQNVKLFIENQNDHYTSMVFTDEKGNANYALSTIGELSLNVYYFDSEFIFNSNRYSTQVNLTVKPEISDIKLIKDFKSNKYSKINSFLEVRMISNHTDDLSDRTVIFKVFTGENYKTYTKTTDSDGNVIFEIPEKLDAGVHKIQVIAGKEIMKTTSIKIDKARTIVNAPKVTNKFKKSKYFKVTIKNKETKKMLSNVKVKIKVFTGKKFKTYTVKTNKNGIAKINTKNLKIGTHKVAILSGNKNYSISKNSLIKIKK